MMTARARVLPAIAVLALVLAAGAPRTASAAPGQALAESSPSPGPERLQPTAAQRAAAVPAVLRTQPMRTVRIPGLIAAPVTPAMQDVVVPVKRGALNDSRLRLDCTQHMLEVARITGTVTPGGTMTIHGRCFGSKPGGVQMSGDRIFSSAGYTGLIVTSWTDDTVLATVPPLRGLVDQPVRIRLALGTGRLSKRDGGAVATFSDQVTMMFTATRETAALLGRYITDDCTRTGANFEDTCRPCTNSDSAKLQDFAYHYGEHWRATPASGVDRWRANLPEGWRFDRIEYQSFPLADVTVDPPGADPSIVQWHVQWRTMHHDEKRPDYEGLRQRLDEHEASYYGGLLYVTGPAGTQSPRYTDNGRLYC